MRKVNILLLISCLQIIKVSAQDFDNLRTTTPPSAVVLGYEPNNIERPSTPQTLAASLQSAFDNQGRFKPNFNIELAPFWAIDRKNYDIEQYLKESNLGTKIWRSFVVSFSTSQSDTVKYGNYTPGIGLSGGLRFLLLDYQTPQSQRNIQNLLSDKFYIPTIFVMTGQNTASRINDTIQHSQYYANLDSLERLDYIGLTGNKVLDLAIEGLPDDDKRDKTIKVISKAKEKVFELKEKYIKDFNTCKAIGEAYKLPINANNCDFLVSPIAFANELTIYFSGLYDDKNLNAYADSLNVIMDKALPTARDGFTFEINMAGSGVLQGNKVTNSVPGKFAIWAVPSYRFNILTDSNIDGSIDILAVARVTFNGHDKNNKSLMVDSVNYYDLGLKIAGRYKKFSLSFEAIYRSNFKMRGINVSDELVKKSTWRLAANFDYKINDYLGVQMTFGRDFDGKAINFEKAKAGSLFYSSGLNLGLAALKDNKKK